MKIIDLSYQKIVEKPEEILDIFEKSIELGFEGIMAKKLDAVYQAGARNYNWVKFKHVGKGKLLDTLDCVVMGYYRGQGKRTGFGIGAFLVGIRQQNQKSRRKNQNEGKILTIAKIGTGLSDEQWKEMRKKCEKNAGKNKPEEYDVAKDLIPDVWVKPKIVVEIAADELTKSPLHTADLALRFPRLISFRGDKGVEEATTITEVEKLAKMASTNS